MALPDNLPTPRGAPLDEQDREGWRITDERSAEWVMRKLAHVREQLTRQAVLRDEYRQQLEDWWQDATRSLFHDVEWAEGLLIAWAMERRDEDPDAKSIILPSGRVSTRWVPPHPQADDPGALAASLARAHHPNYDRVVRAEIKVDARALNQLTTLADEWGLVLSCGCSTIVWQLGGDHVITEGETWPWRPSEHAGTAHRADHDNAKLAVASARRGRIGVPVTVIERDEGQRVVVLDGVSIVPGRVTGSVNPR